MPIRVKNARYLIVKLTMEETSTGVKASFSHLNKLVAGVIGEGLGQFQADPMDKGAASRSKTDSCCSPVRMALGVTGGASDRFPSFWSRPKC